MLSRNADAAHDALNGADDSGVLLADWVYATLLAQISSRRLLPGAPLSVPAIASELKVSRSPVRESVQRLISEGLAVHTPRAGAKLATLDEEGIFDVLRLRQVLDGYAAREATARASTSDIARLSAIVEQQAALGQERIDPRREAALDAEFHALIRDLTGSPALRDALRRLETKANLFHSEIWLSRHNRDVAILEHRSILASIDAGDAASAEAAANAHVAGYMIRMRRWIRDEAAGRQDPP